MKRLIKKFWGVGLVVIILSSLFVLPAAPVSAADPLLWNLEPTLGQGNVSGYALEAGLNLSDIAINGNTIYAVGHLVGAAETVTATVTTTFANTAVANVYNVTYINQVYGTSVGTLTFALNQAAATTAALALAVGDTGVYDIISIAITAGDATAGAFSLASGTTATALGTSTFTPVFTDGAPIPDQSRLYKSTNAGVTWTLITTGTLGIVSTDLVAVAPDDPNTVVVVDKTSVIGAATAWVSTNGAVTFASMGTPGVITVINDLAISAAWAGTHYVALAGNVAANPALYYFNLGSAAPAWTNAAFTAGPWTAPAMVATQSFYTVAFSPAFASDLIAVVVAGNNAAGGLVQLYAASFNAYKWNAAIGNFAPYPATIDTAVGALAMTCASITLDPAYMGGDETLRNAFVAYDGTDAAVQTGGVFRMNDGTRKELTSTAAPYKSVAYNGSVLLMGDYADNVIWYCTDMLSAAPTLLPARSFKRLGVDDAGNDQVVVGFCGANGVAIKRGSAAAFGVSRNNGMTWNSVSLINSALTTINDVQVSADGTTRYVAATDATETSVYYYNATTWEKIFCVPTIGPCMVRLAPDNGSVIYLANTGATALYYSADGGQTRWYQYTAPGAMTDLAVETSDNIYIASGPNIRKSTTRGFNWGPPLTPEISGDNAMSIRSISVNNVLVGGNAGHVSYSNDGGNTWVKIAPAVSIGATNTYAIASDLNNGSYIYAVNVANINVSRWQIGTSTAWYDMACPNTAGYFNQDIKLIGTTLYVTSSTAANQELYRTLIPTMATMVAGYWSKWIPLDGRVFKDVPDALNMSAGYKLWAVDTLGNNIYSYVDSLADPASVPALSGPANGALINFNTATGTPYNTTFLWSRISLATNYDFQVALDSAFTQIMVNNVACGNTAPTQAMTCGALFVGNTASTSQLTMTPGLTYYWRVRADQPLFSNWSAVRSVVIQPSPANVPTISSPTNGATILSRSPAFSWSPVALTTQYDFQLSTTPTFGTTVLTDQPTSTGTLVPVTILLDQGKQYFWRVRALQPVQGDWSAVANFIVALPATTAAPAVVVTQPPAITISIPAPQAATTYTLAQPEVKEIAPSYIWAIIIIGGILVIAVIVLIVRTRRSV